MVREIESRVVAGHHSLAVPDDTARKSEQAPDCHSLRTRFDPLPLASRGNEIHTEIDRRESGYYSNPNFIGEYISNRLIFYNPSGTKVLDPCCGKDELLSSFIKIGKDVTGTCSQSMATTVNVTENPAPVITLTVDPVLDTICDGGNTSIDLNLTTGTAPYTFTISDGTALVSS